MNAEILNQLTVCDVCQRRFAFLCWIRLRLRLCFRCAVILELASGEQLTGEDIDREAA